MIVALLSATSVQALLTLERLASHGRQTAHEAVQLTENAQRLAERTIAMERSARQFLVLNDPAFRTRYQEVWSEAREALSELEAWVSQSESAWALLQTDPLQRMENQAVLAAVFVRLPAINDLLSKEALIFIVRPHSRLVSPGHLLVASSCSPRAAGKNR